MSPPTDVILTVRSTRQFPIEDYLVNCVETLVKHTGNYRLIFVDDNSDEIGAQMVDKIAKQFSNALLIRSNFQRWFTRAVNLGLRMARTDRVVVLNSDTVLGPGWLEELYAVWTEVEQTTHARVGLVGSLQSEEEPRRYALSVGKDYVTGHCLLVSMQALYDASAARRQPGIYLDETRADAIHIRSDVYICWELNRLGWQTVKSFKAAVGHHGGKSWGHQLHTIPNSLDAVNERWQ